MKRWHPNSRTRLGQVQRRIANRTTDVAHVAHVADVAPRSSREKDPGATSGILAHCLAAAIARTSRSYLAIRAEFTTDTYPQKTLKA